MSPLADFWRRAPSPKERLMGLRECEMRLVARLEIYRREEASRWAIQDIESSLAHTRRAVRAAEAELGGRGRVA